MSAIYGDKHIVDKYLTTSCYAHHPKDMIAAEGPPIKNKHKKTISNSKHWPGLAKGTRHCLSFARGRLYMTLYADGGIGVTVLSSIVRKRVGQAEIGRTSGQK